jgi:hypothetical protein
MSNVRLTSSIPLSIMVGLLIQTGAFIWFLSQLNSRVESNTTKIKERGEWMVDRERFEKDITSQMIRLTMTAEQLSLSSEKLAVTIEDLNVRMRGQ